jgi:hypothetical protein
MKGKEIIVTFSEPWYGDQMDLIYHPLTKELFTKVSKQIYAPKEPIITNTAFDEAVMEEFRKLISDDNNLINITELYKNHE